jgi:CotH kinase protein/Secretion system C-terminal sorting domain
MLFRCTFFCLMAGFVLPINAQPNALFDDRQVSEIRVQMPEDSVNWMLAKLVNTRYMRADFMVFNDGVRRDTIWNIGIRLRGNTSLNARKKSFKISFNEFVSGRSYQGVKKLNLRGSHNDPTMIREKLFYEIWEKAGMPPRRAAFVKLFINDTYRGVYTNIEEIDKSWLDRVYDDNDGNLYKCTWPANLGFLGFDQKPYKDLKNNPSTRAYDLVTNETEDDYSRLVSLITNLNSATDAAYPARLSVWLNIESALKSYALDVLTGNWDDYFFNKNNYYVYDDPAQGRFQFFTFDTDNTFGITWENIDWAKRNCLNWQHPTEPRPLATKLLTVPAFRGRFVQILDSVSRHITHPDSIFPRIDALHALITPAAAEDVYRTLDYGYTMNDFHKAFEQKLSGHVAYGIKPFLATRYQNTRSQIALLLDEKSPEKPLLQVNISPNPANANLTISVSEPLWDYQLWDMNGQLIQVEQQIEILDKKLIISHLDHGMYCLYIRTGTGQSMIRKFVVAR